MSSLRVLWLHFFCATALHSVSAVIHDSYFISLGCYTASHNKLPSFWERCVWVYYKENLKWPVMNDAHLCLGE